MEETPAVSTARARVQRLIVASWPAAAWLLALAAYRHFHHSLPLLAAAVWGGMLLASFTAWGRLLTSRTGYGRMGWGFDASVGMALTLSVFGLLALVRIASTPAIVVWSAAAPLALGLGLAQARGETRPVTLAALRTRATRWLRRPRPLAFSAGVVTLYVMAALQYAHSVADTTFNTWDDEMAYRSFARQFIDTGTLYEPFSYRRIGAFGGQSLLHAMVLALSDRDRLHLLDNGICVLVVLGLVTGYRAVARPAARPAVLLAGLLAMSLPYTPHNTAAAISGVVLFLALFRLFDDPRFVSARAGHNAVLVGLLVAAVCTLRQNFLAAAVVFVAAAYLTHLAWPDEKGRREWLWQGLLAAAATVVLLAPWMALSFRAAHTALYPILKGNVRPDFGIVGKAPWFEALRWAIKNLFFFKPIASIGLFFVAAIALPSWRRSMALHAFVLANAASFAMMMYVFQSFDDSESIARYYFAFAVALCIAVTLRCVGDASIRRGTARALAPAALAITAVGLHFADAKDTLQDLYEKRVTSLHDVLTQGPTAATPDDALYQKLQGSVPSGAPILVILDHAHLLDGRRNPLFQYDHPGAMGPAPGPPCFKGPDAFAQYLRSVGVRYVAYQIGPSSQEYNPDIWKPRAAEVVPANGREHAFYKNQARFELDFFDTMKALAKSHRQVFREGDLAVMDLESPAT
jgi:hypothetical protein